MKLAFTLLFIFILSPLFPDETTGEIAANSLTIKESQVDESGYTINYNNVSIIEYIKFVTKICNVNFLFDEPDLNFKVTVVSEDPITPQSVLSTLVQILRIHGLSLLEQDKNLVIHKNPDVKQIAKLVLDNQPIDSSYPIVTKVFYVQNAKAEAVAAIVKPMLSTEAILDIFPEANLLILTDITQNVEKIALLIENLQSPQSAVTIEPYRVKFNEPAFLISMATQIMAPMTHGHPFIMVPQPKASSIFIVSTPALVEKAISVLNNIDTKPGKGVVKELTTHNIFLYKAVHRPLSEIIRGLKDITQNIQTSGYSEKGLVESIDNVHSIKETQSLLFTGEPDTLNKIRELLSALDVPTKEIATESFFMYKPEHRNVSDVYDALKEVIDNLSHAKVVEKNLLETLESGKVVATTQTIVFIGEPTTFPKVKELLNSVDIPAKGLIGGKSTFIVYQVKNMPAPLLEATIKDFLKTLEKSGIADLGFVQALESMKYMPDTNLLIFTGDDKSLKRVQEILPSFDQTIFAKKIMLKAQFLVYKPKFLKGEEVAAALKDIETNLKSSGLADPSLIHSLDSMRWVKATNSLLFTGDPESLKKIEELIQKVDLHPQIKPGLEKTFFIYQLQYVPRNKAEEYLSQVADNLTNKGLGEEDLIDAIHSIQWIPESHSYIFSGTQTALTRIKEILTSFDIPPAKAIAASQPLFIICKLQNACKEKMQDYLHQIASNLNLSEEKQKNLYDTIHGMKWIPESHAFMFSGTKEALDQVQELAKDFDISHNVPTQTYYVYKLVHVAGSIIEEDLAKLSEKMKSSGFIDKEFLHVIDNSQWIKETNSILLTGSTQAVQATRELIAQFDIPGSLARQTDFLMYKPLHLPPTQLEKILKETGENLKKANLADNSLLTTIATAQYNDSTHSILFTGSPQILSKIEILLKEIDISSAKTTPIQHIGKTTFLLYKLKAANGLQIVKSLANFTSDLKKSGTSDKEFLSALNSIKFIKETNSLLFTGTEQALEKIKPLVDRFDIPELNSAQVELLPSNFFIYKPQYITGLQLEQLLIDFVNHLQEAGLHNQNLYETVHHAQWVEKSGNLVFVGDDKTLDQIKDLIKNFDIALEKLPTQETTIQSIENTSFLVYKLQYHRGDEIQNALRAIGADLLKNNSSINKSLLDAIHAIQWLQVTNSLLASGNQETLTRLKELIKNLDVPLKQVFIEVLVISTTLTNILNFGLNWGSKVQYRQDFAASSGLFNTTPAGSSGNPNLPSAISSLNTTTTPNPTSIPFETNFDLGVIGDIIFHKGQSYVSLGSLMQALQTDSETTIVMTPKIISQDNKTSNIFIGKNIPFVGSFVQNTQQNTLSTTNLEYRDIGMNLTITPVLGNSDVVTLDIALDNTAVPTNAAGQTTNVSVGGVQGITTTKTSLNTTVHVPNESFLVLSGMIDASKVKQKTGIPCLGGLPLIGAAFSSLNISDTQDNLIIFMRPHIINSYADIKRITGDQEDQFFENTGSVNLESDFDEAMELIKSVNDD